MCVHSQPLRSGMYRGDTDRTVGSSSSFWERADGLQGADSAGTQHPAAWRASLPSIAEEAVLCARQRNIGDGFLVPELKGGSESSEDEQADNVSNESQYVIGSHELGDNISCYFQDCKVAVVALSFHIALDMLCQEFCKGNEPCTSYSRTFTIHNYGCGTAYTFTHNNITLEHTAMNDKNTITHTDANGTQF